MAKIRIHELAKELKKENKEILQFLADKGIEGKTASSGLDASEEQIVNIVNRILDKDFYDKKGLIYGIGHPVYTKSDPRAILLKEKCKDIPLKLAANGSPLTEDEAKELYKLLYKFLG